MSETVLVFGESQWRQLSSLLSAVPATTPVVRATTASQAMTALAEYMPCRVVFLVPPDVTEMLTVLHELRRHRQLSVTVVDPAMDDRVERFSRLAGCTEYQAVTPAPATPMERPAMWGSGERTDASLADRLLSGGVE